MSDYTKHPDGAGAERTAEDVRLNPIAGDMADWGEGPQEVRHIDHDGAVWVIDIAMESVGLHDLEFWRKWSADAEVIHIAREPKP